MRTDIIYYYSRLSQIINYITVNRGVEEFRTSSKAAGSRKNTTLIRFGSIYVMIRTAWQVYLTRYYGGNRPHTLNKMYAEWN